MAKHVVILPNMSQENAKVSAKKRTDYPEYRRNPSVTEAMKMMQPRSLPTQQGETTLIVGSDTGEVLGQGSVMFLERKIIDGENFCKVYANSLGRMLQLPKAAHRVLEVLYHLVAARHNIDNVAMHHAICEEFDEPRIRTMSRRTFDRGIHELLEASILFRTPIPHHYFYNVTMIYNGDRVVLAQEYVRNTAIAGTLLGDPEQKVFELE